MAMPMNIEEVSAIAGTLPIGYYLGVRIPVEVVPSTNGLKKKIEHGYNGSIYKDMESFYSRTDNKIILSMKDIVKAASVIDETKWKPEELVRCILYRLIGFILMTPSWYKDGCIRNIQDADVLLSNNMRDVFEEARVMALLENAFLDTPFARYVSETADAVEKELESESDARFYRIVVGHKFENESQARVLWNAIANLSNINSMSAEKGNAKGSKVITNRGIYCNNFREVFITVFASNVQKMKSSEHARRYLKEMQDNLSSVRDRIKQRTKAISDDIMRGMDPAVAWRLRSMMNDRIYSKVISEGATDTNDKNSFAGERLTGFCQQDRIDDLIEALNNLKDTANSEKILKVIRTSTLKKNFNNERTVQSELQTGVEGVLKAIQGAQDNMLKRDEDGVNGKSIPVGEAGAEGEGEVEGKGSDGNGVPPNVWTPVLEAGQCRQNMKLAAGSITDVGDEGKKIRRKMNELTMRLAKRDGVSRASVYSPFRGHLKAARLAQDKDKFFIRKADEGERKMKGVNLTLWLDESGSFSYAEDKLNDIIAGIISASKTISQLKINKVRMEEHATVQELKGDKAAANCIFGNNIDKTFLEAYYKTRDLTRRNVDIVVYDGEMGASRVMYPNPDRSAMEQRQIIQTIWNRRDVWIVSDRSNEKQLNFCCPEARRKYLTGGYADALGDVLCDVLDRII